VLCCVVLCCVVLCCVVLCCVVLCCVVLCCVALLCCVPFDRPLTLERCQVNTGYSYSDSGDIGVVSEAEMADNMYEFLQKFLAKYPKYSQLPFFITGESYAGHCTHRSSLCLACPLLFSCVLFCSACLTLCHYSAQQTSRR
jgi:hypothetical protein